MTERTGGVTGHQGESRWRVRLRDRPAGIVVGAGLLVGREHVLTCAHVIAGLHGSSPVGPATEPTMDVTVDLVGVPDQPSVSARVEKGCWVPPASDGSGDVALLRLFTPQREEDADPMHRLAPIPGRPVSICGFPQGLEGGSWLRATLAGPAGPKGEWVQLDPLPERPSVSPGFSGAGVQDHESGRVIGMVVSRYVSTHSQSYMLPTESIVKYLPDLADRVGGQRAIKRSIAGGSDARMDPLDASDSVDLAQEDSVGFAQEVVDWLTRPPRGESVRLVVAGDPTTVRSSVVRRAVMLSDREWRGRDEVAGRAPEGTVPPVGSIDLAVDVAGLTVDEVSRRIVDRLRIPDQDGMPPRDWLRSSALPMNLVVEGVEDAIQPEALVTDVLGLLVARGSRLLLVLRRPPRGSLSRAVESITAVSWSEAIRERLRLLAARVEDLTAAERAAEDLLAEIRKRGTLEPAVPTVASEFRLALTVFRKRVEAKTTSQERLELYESLESCERRVEQSLQRVAAVRQDLARRTQRGSGSTLADRDVVRELRGRLDAYAAKVADAGIVEDEDLAAAYRSAYDLVWSAPCDLPAATEALRHYVAAARHRLEE